MELESDYFLSKEYLLNKLKKSIENNYFLSKPKRPEEKNPIWLSKLVNPHLYLPLSPRSQENHAKILNMEGQKQVNSLVPNQRQSLTPLRKRFLGKEKHSENMLKIHKSINCNKFQKNKFIDSNSSKIKNQNLIKASIFDVKNIKNIENNLNSSHCEASISSKEKINSKSQKIEKHKDKLDDSILMQNLYSSHKGKRVFVTHTNVKQRSKDDLIEYKEFIEYKRINETNERNELEELTKTHDPNPSLPKSTELLSIIKNANLSLQDKPPSSSNTARPQTEFLKKVNQTCYNYTDTIKKKIESKYKINQRIHSERKSHLGFGERKCKTPGQIRSPTDKENAHLHAARCRKDIPIRSIKSHVAGEGEGGVAESKSEGFKRSKEKEIGTACEDDAQPACQDEEINASEQVVPKVLEPVQIQLKQDSNRKHRKTKSQNPPVSDHPQLSSKQIYNFEGFKHMSIKELIQHERGLLNLYDNPHVVAPPDHFHNKNPNQFRLSQNQYNSIFDPTENNFYERKAFVTLFRKKWKEDKGYCSLFDKRFKYKQANSIEKDVHIKNIHFKGNAPNVNPFKRKSASRQENKRIAMRKTFLQGVPMEITRGPAKLFVQRSSTRPISKGGNLKLDPEKMRKELENINGIKDLNITGIRNLTKKEVNERKSKQNENSANSLCAVAESEFLSNYSGTSPFTILIAQKGGRELQLDDYTSGATSPNTGTGGYTPKRSAYISRQKTIKERNKSLYQKNPLNSSTGMPESPHQAHPNALNKSFGFGLLPLEPSHHHHHPHTAHPDLSRTHNNIHSPHSQVNSNSNRGANHPTLFNDVGDPRVGNASASAADATAGAGVSNKERGKEGKIGGEIKRIQDFDEHDTQLPYPIAVTLTDKSSHEFIHTQNMQECQSTLTNQSLSFHQKQQVDQNTMQQVHRQATNDSTMFAISKSEMDNINKLDQYPL